MKTMLACLLALCLMLPLALPAAAEAAPEFVLEGLVTETTEEGFVMDDLTLGSVEVLFAPDTQYEGITAESASVAVGQYLFVRYDGRLTKSLPPQAVAGKISCFAVSGTVETLDESSALLTGDELYGDVLVRFEEAPAYLLPGLRVTVYYNGVMAMSLPGQIGALYVDAPALSGTVSDLTAEGFTLTDADGATHRIALTAETVGAADLIDGVYADVLYAPADTDDAAEKDEPADADDAADTDEPAAPVLALYVFAASALQEDASGDAL